MQDSNSIDACSVLEYQGLSNKALGENRAVDGTDAYSDLSANSSHRLRRMPRLRSREGFNRTAH